MSVKDVNQTDFVKALATFLKRTGKIDVPEYRDIVKLARFNELAPTDDDWYYIRAAAVARHLYMRSPCGVGGFRKVFGGRQRRGTRPSHFCKSYGGILRKILQNLEALNLVEKDTSGGRRLTNQGRRDMDRIANQVVKKQKKVVAPRD